MLARGQVEVKITQINKAGPSIKPMVSLHYIGISSLLMCISFFGTLAKRQEKFAPIYIKISPLDIRIDLHRSQYFMLCLLAATKAKTCRLQQHLTSVQTLSSKTNKPNEKTSQTRPGSPFQMLVESEIFLMVAYVCFVYKHNREVVCIL